MAIIDRSVVVLACNQSDYSDGALIGQELPITAMLVNALTETAAVETVAAVEAPPLDSRSRNVLRQLTLGATDEKGARELGITLRTYRRIVSRLMEVLDAESRFQAGYLAMKRNWL
jgi:DNA-binding NarL/FixJ family response regulator